MKQIIGVLAILAVLFDFISIPTVVLAEENLGSDILESISEEDWYNGEGNLQYPITLDDERWPYLFSNENKYHACQIPEKILQDLSTEELLYMVEQYPNFTVLMWYEDAQEGFLTLKENFNGLAALLEREDCKEVVLEEYNNFQISEKARYNYSANIKEETQAEDMNRIMKDSGAMVLVRQDAREKYIVSILEKILAQKEIQEQFTQADVETLGKVIVEKMQMEEKSECFGYEAQKSFEAVAGTDNEVMAYVYEEELSTARKNVIMGQADNILQPLTSIDPPDAPFPIPALYTRSGTVIPFTRAKKATVNEADCLTIVAAYIDCTILEYKEYGYNCYAYAWLSLDAKNRPYRKLVNVPTEEVFIQDSKYKAYTTVEKGMVVSYWGGHAGVVEQVNYTYYDGKTGKTEPLVSSPWACNALIQHPLSQGDFGSPVFYK